MRLAVEELTAGYGELTVLRGVSLDAEQGELVALIGANGAGKTTLLRAISGLIPAKSGRILLGGTRLHGKPAHRVVADGVSHVPEGRGMLPGLTVRENLALGANARRSRGRFDLDRVFSLFPVLGQRLDQSCDMLSGGEQQMLAVARALLADPEILIVDELSLGLSPIITAELLALLNGLKRDGVGILLVDQNIHQLLDIADRVHVLVNGRIAFSGTAAALRSEHDLLATFFGD